MPWWELAFYACNYGVIGAWLLLAVAPKSEVTRRVVFSGFVPFLFGTAYGVILFADWGSSPDAHVFTLDGVMAVFTSRPTVVAAWIHYLIFDLFVGAWITRDAARHGIRHLWVVPLLFTTLAFGPLGLVGYLLLRGVRTGRWSTEEVVSSAAG
ncbi:MAG: ABA4-like family protein [Sandaracinaceae bacterium]